MDLLDSEVLKGAVDLLTKILETINNLTERIGGENSGAVKIGLIVASLTMADKALTIFKTSMGEGKTIAQSFGAIWTTTIDGIRAKLEGMKTTISDTYAAALDKTNQGLENRMTEGKIKKSDKIKISKPTNPKVDNKQKAVDDYTKALNKQQAAIAKSQEA
jgi:hypothetical protein